MVFGCLFLSLVASSQVKREKFPNNSTKTLVFESGKEFDIVENNPFIIDREPDRRTASAYKYRHVKLSDKGVSEMFNKVGWRNGIEPENLKHYNFTAMTGGIDENNFILVSYLLLIYSDYDELLGQASRLIVLDSTGEKVFEKHFPFDCLSPSITNDGKTIGFKTGGQHDESLIPVKKSRAAFYNIAKDTIVLNIFPEDSSYLGGMGAINNMFFVRIENSYKKELKNFFYKTESERLYSTVLNYYQYRRIVEFNDQGIYFSKDQNDTIVYKKLLFEKDFKKEAMP